MRRREVMLRAVSGLVALAALLGGGCAGLSGGQKPVSFRHEPDASAGRSGELKGAFGPEIVCEQDLRPVLSRLVFSFRYSVQAAAKRIRNPVVCGMVLSEYRDGTRWMERACQYRPTRGFESLSRQGGDVLSRREREVEAASVADVVVTQAEFPVGRTFGGAVKILVWRLELWQDGQCLDSHTSLDSGEMQRLGIPADWHRDDIGVFRAGAAQTPADRR